MNKKRKLNDHDQRNAHVILFYLELGVKEVGDRI